MAKAAGIEMAECRLLEEGGRRHFMTKRFDRTPDHSKLHMQSLAALQHFDYIKSGSYSYEMAFLTMRKLDDSAEAVEQLFLRAAFNILARNLDDHVKNLAFLMNQEGEWKLAPAFDLTCGYDPAYVERGQEMPLHGKRREFVLEDFLAFGKLLMLKRGRVTTLLEQVASAIERWREFASKAGVDEHRVDQIAKVHDLGILDRSTAPGPSRPSTLDTDSITLE
jgi:serine/threonine-protein kinase HipA